MPPWSITSEGPSEVQSTAETITRRACRCYTCRSRPPRALVQSGSRGRSPKAKLALVFIRESGMAGRNTQKPRTGPGVSLLDLLDLL